MQTPLWEAFQEIRLISALNASCITVLVYDYLITLDDEITYVWSSKWNVGKILFLLVRYPVFLDILVVKVANMSPLPAEYCQALVYTEEWLFTVGIAIFAGEQLYLRPSIRPIPLTLILVGMLALRTWVIWDRTRTITWILISLLSSLWTIMLVFACLNLTAKTQFFSYPPNVRNMGCLIVGRMASPNFFFIDIAIGAYELCIFALTSLRIYRSNWSRRILPAMTRIAMKSPPDPSSPDPSPVLSVLYRDALLNYVLLLVVINLCLLSVTPVRKDILAPAALGWQRAAHSILGSRTLLRMRKVLVDARSGNSKQKQTITTIRFQHPADSVLERTNSENPSVSPVGENFIAEDWFAPISKLETRPVLPIAPTGRPGLWQNGTRSGLAGSERPD